MMMMMMIMYSLVHYVVWPVVANISETITDEVMRRLFGPDVVVAEIIHPDRPGVQTKMSDVPVAEKLEKFVEDVKWVVITIALCSMCRINEDVTALFCSVAVCWTETCIASCRQNFFVEERDVPLNCSNFCRHCPCACTQCTVGVVTDLLFFLNETWHFQAVLTELLMQSLKSSGMLHCVVSPTGTSV